MTRRMLPLVLVLALGLAGCHVPEKGASASSAGQVGAERDAPREGGATAAEAASAAGTVSLGAEGRKLIGLTTEAVQLRELPTTLATTGEVAANADREAHVTTRVPGRVIGVGKTVGDWVRAGEAIATLESVELGQAQADFLQAQAKDELAQSMLERQRQLFVGHLTAKKEVQAAENARRLARIDLERTTNELKLLGFGEARIAALQRTRQIDPKSPLLAPIHGVVIAKHLTLGELLKPDASEPAFTLSDTSRLWVNADVYEKDLGRVQAGQAATVTTAAYPGRAYRGTVSLVSATLDKASRTAKAKIVVPNPDGKLKPEMFANVRIELGKRRVLAVPRAAVQAEDRRKLVYVPLGGDAFKEVPVQLGTAYAAYDEVLSGLEPGDLVVTRGSFDLHAQARKASFGGED